MASAGRILILPKGDYDSTKEYEMLDLVFHGGTSWLAKKSSVGVEPSDANAEYWFKMCQSVDLSEIIRRIAALEAQMLGTISLDDIDLSGYATKTELANYATKTEMNSINTSLDGRLDVVEPKVSNLVSDVNTAKTNISNLQTLVGGISSAKFQVVSYKGTGSVGANNPCSVTLNFAPKVLLYLGYHHNYADTTILQEGATSAGYTFTKDVIICEHLTTTYHVSMGFKVTTNDGDSIDRFAKKSADGKTIYWYVTNGTPSPDHQLNNSMRYYYFLAIG